MSLGRFKSKIFLTVLILLFTFMLLTCAYNNSVKTENITAEAAEGDTAVIAHLTDIHYFPSYYCYNGANENSEYSKSIGSDTKLLSESGDILRKTCSDLLLKKPDYLVVSGDISSNAERRGMIDVANALRKLQNSLRANGKPNFQIFVVPGNHDLYNHRAKSFATEDGSEILAPTITRKDFSIIFAGLGYPNVTLTEAQEFYSAEEWNINSENLLPYDLEASATSTYIESNLSTYFDYQYKYVDIYADYKTRQDYSMGDLTYIATSNNDNKYKYSFIGLDTVKSNADKGNYNFTTHLFENKDKTEGHICGGIINENLYNWLNTKEDDLKTKNTTIISISHHNVLPHFSKEENILKDFVLDYWEDAAEFLSNYANGVRYHFSGHMHANDVAMYTSFTNNVLYDFETSSIITYSPSIRYTTIVRSLVSGKTYEKTTTQVVNVNNVDFTNLFAKNYLDNDYVDNVNNPVKSTFTDFNNKYLCTDLFEYINKVRYEALVESIISSYITPSTISMLTDMIDSFELPSFINNFKPEIKIIINNLIEQINTKVLADYTYSGNNVDYLPGGIYEDDKLFAYVLELVEKIAFENIVKVSETEQYSLVDIVLTGLTSHANGNEKSTYKELPTWMQLSLDKLNNGEILGNLIDTLLDKENGLYSLVIRLISTEIDLTNGLSLAKINLIKSALSISTGLEVDLKKLKLADYIGPIINFLKLDLDVGDNVVTFADDLISKYYTESLKTGLGGIAGDILLSLVTDNYTDGAVGAIKEVEYKATDTYTYMGVPRTDITPTIENGRLPSKLTVTFGDDPKTSKNFIYFTDKSINATDIQYIKASEYNSSQNFDTQSIKKQGICELYAYSYPLMDLGLFATFRTKITARHSITLTSLEEGTEYKYRIGSAAQNYWSDVYSFKTAPGNNAPFEILLMTDVQGFINASYDDAYKVLTGAKKSFANYDYDFIINCGDSVDNGQNSSQWNYALNTLKDVYSNITQVVANGNHEDNYYEDTEYVVDNNQNVNTSAYNSLSLYYKFPNVPSQDSSIKTGIYYSFDYSNVHFVVLNTNDISATNTLGEAQSEWLVNDLKATDKTYKIVIMHKGLYTAGAHSYDADVIGLRKQLTPIFSDNNVNLVLQGHDHTYSETYYLDRNGKAIETDKTGDYKLGNPDGGVLYVTLGTLGDKYYSYVENDAVPVNYGDDLHTSLNSTLANPTFGKLLYDGNNLYYQGFQYNLANNTTIILEPKNNEQYDKLMKLLIGTGIGLGIIVIGISSVLLSIHIRKKNFMKQTQNNGNDL